MYLHLKGSQKISPQDLFQDRIFHDGRKYNFMCLSGDISWPACDCFKYIAFHLKYIRGRISKNTFCSFLHCFYFYFLLYFFFYIVFKLLHVDVSEPVVQWQNLIIIDTNWKSVGTSKTVKITIIY